MLLSAILIVFASDDNLLISPAPTVAAKASVGANDAANALYSLGLLAGVGNNADGTVNFAVDGSLTRAQSITQVVRFLGAEKTATTTTNAYPFTDLADWAVPYISYAYANGITQGVSATKFDSDSAMSEAAFLTAILRVLGYVDKNDGSGDFIWSDPYTLALDTGLVSDADKNADFKRGDAFVICYNALTATVKTGDSIADRLIAAGIFTKEKFDEVMGNTNDKPDETNKPEETDKPEIPEDPVTELITIDKLEQKSTNGDHANDKISTASLETNFREHVVLSSVTTGSSRYDNAWYPRIKQVKDDLYVMFWMYGQYGRHIYVAYSNDGQTWTEPEVFWAADNTKKFTHTDGALAGTDDQMLAVNADACVLDNGDILCVYGVRPSTGYNYRDYIELNGIYLRRGTVGADNKITWSDEVQITQGQVWEPFIFQRENGRVELYWSCAIAYINLYDMDRDKRSTCVSMMYSDDNGETWQPGTKKENNYVGLRVYQEYIGDKVPYGTNEDGTPKYTEAVKYFGGQMPSVTELYNGRLFLAAEVHQLDKNFHISVARSEEDGSWKNLDLLEDGPSTSMNPAFKGEGAAPYVARFESGEVYLTYTLNAVLRARMISADGTEIDNKEFRPTPAARGSWGASEILDSHKVVTVNPDVDGDKRSIMIYYSYLNHRINAPKTSVSVDGYTNDWVNNTDALFVGSETQAQITVRTAHDDENVYFLISRPDTYVTDGDTATVCIAAGTNSYYRVIVDLNGIASVEFVENGSVKNTLENSGKAAVKVLGTVGDNTDKDEGVVTEVAIPKALVGLTGKTSFAINPSLNNQDGSGSTTDILTGVSTFNTGRWPEVVLD